MFDFSFRLYLPTYLQVDDDQDEESLAEQYRGTPPLRTKKKKQGHRYSHEITEQVNVKVCLEIIIQGEQFIFRVGALV